MAERDTVKLTCTIGTAEMQFLVDERNELTKRAGVEVPLSAVVRASIRYAQRMRRSIDDWDALAR